MGSVARKFLRLAAAGLMLGALSAAPAPAPAQCALCRTAVQQADDRTASTMNLAILVLLIPPVSIFCAIFAVAYRKAKEVDEDQNRRP